MDVRAVQRGRPRWASAGAVPGQGPRGQGRETAASPSARLSARPAPHCEGGHGRAPRPPRAPAPTTPPPAAQELERRAADGRRAETPAAGAGCAHLRLPEVIVHHGEVEAQLLDVALVALEEEQVPVHLRVQRGQVVYVHIRAGAQQLGQEEAGEGQLHQHVLVEGLGRGQGPVSTSRAPLRTSENGDGRPDPPGSWRSRRRSSPLAVAGTGTPPTGRPASARESGLPSAENPRTDCQRISGLKFQDAKLRPSSSP